MAEKQGVWAIDIGQAGLKALHLRYAEAADQAIAVGFDYVQHPKILSQPDAIPEELIPQALERFLSRNEVRGERICISVPGQSTLARFIKLPPVESSKVNEIITYEARQQIPFALEDVIWDYQPLGGGVEESGFMLEAEIGLFAMKREQVLQHLKPFDDAKVDVDLIQVAPLGLYNVLSYDQMGIRAGQEEIEADDGYTIVLDMGADNTTLLVSNGETIWIRNVPIGGNHFTRALTKEMKLTFAKAEHLKCNATKSPDPRAVFQALRPVFNDYVSEIQRSVGYFSSVNRDAKIKKVIGVGNGFKLAGLQKFLQQNLQYPVERLESFGALAGDKVLGATLFQENILSFAVPYGLALQGLGLTRIHTSLLPPEIAMARKIQRKKPWAVAAAATLLVGFSMSAAGYSHVWHSVSPDRFGEAEEQVETLTSRVSQFESGYTEAKSQYENLQEQGQKLVQNLDSREYWIEIYKAINECLPRDDRANLEELDITERNRVKLLSITSRRLEDLSLWFENTRKNFMLPQDEENPPSGPGYVFTLRGVHYHHDEENPQTGSGGLYVRQTLLKNLQKWTVQHEGSAPVPVRKLGITHATLNADRTRRINFYPDGPRSGDQSGSPMGSSRPMANPGSPPMGQPGSGQQTQVKKIPRTPFTIQFVWKPTPPEERPQEPPQSPSQQQGGNAQPGKQQTGQANSGTNTPPPGGAGNQGPSGGHSQ